jgi:uncharacterized protein (TIGR00288 family)
MDRKKIALLIDYDNFNQEKYLSVLISELNEIGDLLIKYAFYSNLNDGTIKDKFIRLDIEPVAQIAYTNKKNAVDIRMSLEAMDLLNKEFVDCFCLATNDADFTPLVKRLQKANKTVIGAGDNASETFKNACDSFISVDKILNANAPAKDSKEKVAKEFKAEIGKLIVIINEIIDSDHDNEGAATFAQVVDKLYNTIKDFSPKNYGSTNKQALPFFQTTLSPFYEIIIKDKTPYIKKKKQAISLS